MILKFNVTWTAKTRALFYQKYPPKRIL